RHHIACVVKSADLVAPAFQGGLSYDLSALALLMREWSTDTLLTEQTLATFLLTENLNDLHPLLVNNARAMHVKIPLPSAPELAAALALMKDSCSSVLGHGGEEDFDRLAQQLCGATTAAVESMLRVQQHRGRPLRDSDLVALKKQLVEKDCSGLIEFIESKRSLDELHDQDKLKDWLRADFSLWRQNDLAALPMGYLLCGPVGTGKTYMVECLAGEAGVPVVK